MKPVAMLQALVLLVLAVALEAGFLMQVAVPSREAILAAQAAERAEVARAEAADAAVVAGFPNAG